MCFALETGQKTAFSSYVDVNKKWEMLAWCRAWLMDVHHHLYTLPEISWHWVFNGNLNSCLNNLYSCCVRFCAWVLRMKWYPHGNKLCKWSFIFLFFHRKLKVSIRVKKYIMVRKRNEKNQSAFFFLCMRIVKMRFESTIRVH